MSSTNWLLLRSGRGPAVLNMALDEALLEAMPRLSQPVLRFYGWLEPAASFGYFQKYAEVEVLTPLRPLVRRPTGGGIVPHELDWTYSLAFPLTHEWYALTAIESYQRVHQWLCEAFGILGIGSSLAPEGRAVRPGQCFAGCERFDLLLGGHKIAGAAQRRRRDGLLIQGSVQPGALAISRHEWEQAVCAAAVKSWRTTWLDFNPDETLRNRAEALVQCKYSQPSYNQRR